MVLAPKFARKIAHTSRNATRYFSTSRKIFFKIPENILLPIPFDATRENLVPVKLSARRADFGGSNFYA